jgi:hypothetical protein
MIVVPETPITDVSFTKWNPCIKLEVKDENLEDTYHYYIIPLIDVSQQELENNLESIPSLWSSESTEFESEEGVTLYTMRLFDEDLPELTTEEEKRLVLIWKFEKIFVYLRYLFIITLKQTAHKN